MIVFCIAYTKYFDDEYRSTLCPHNTFPANDGNNNFHVHADSYLDSVPPNAIPGMPVWNKDKDQDH